MNAIDFLQINEDILNNAKIHFAIGAHNKLEPLNEFYCNTFKEWQESQNNQNFKEKYILSLVYYGKDEWLYAGIYEQNGVIKKKDKFFYKTVLLNNAEAYIGRLIFKFKKGFRNSYPYLHKQIDNLLILEILRKRYSYQEFPGFNNIRIPHKVLGVIISEADKTWKTALSNVKGVYLISDMLTGKLYVGSAYGHSAFWERWTAYTKTGHGDNASLKELIRKEGVAYAENFHYSILEICSFNTSDDEIIKRESHWKDILLSRKFGYNNN